MTREEAIKVIKRMIKTGIAYDDGYAFEPLTKDEKNACGMAIKALEQEPILDKIKTEIEQVKVIMNEEIIEHNRKDLINFINGINQCLVIIDKYRG